jgi:hypothetical protein
MGEFEVGSSFLCPYAASIEKVEKTKGKPAVTLDSPFVAELFTNGSIIEKTYSSENLP